MLPLNGTAGGGLGHEIDAPFAAASPLPGMCFRVVGLPTSLVPHNRTFVLDHFAEPAAEAGLTPAFSFAFPDSLAGVSTVTSMEQHPPA